MTDLAAIIDRAWEARDGIGPDTTGEVRDAVVRALAMLDSGEARVAEPGARLRRVASRASGRSASMTLVMYSTVIGST